MCRESPERCRMKGDIMKKLTAILLSLLLICTSCASPVQEKSDISPEKPGSEATSAVPMDTIAERTVSENEEATNTDLEIVEVAARKVSIEEVVEYLKNNVSEIIETEIYNEETDINKLLGRLGNYSYFAD